MVQDSSSSSLNNKTARVREESSLHHMESLTARDKRTPKASSSPFSSLCKWVD